MKCKTCDKSLSIASFVQTMGVNSFCDKRCLYLHQGYQDGFGDGYKKGRDDAYVDGLDHGIDIAIHWFWQGVCEKKAQKKEKKAAENRRKATSWVTDIYEAGMYHEIADQRMAEAAQLRAWAVDTDE